MPVGFLDMVQSGEVARFCPSTPKAEAVNIAPSRLFESELTD
ncbi:hypothetical protein KOR42_42140 [Thalassoglobus neptunius]|uniref:Uncharacterized protein n=1 Tax=Thalassoglobus neptunius TaxID=1938619 RepID=A0A5C5W8W7_9PLAN|nr:hypothetical protein KOR42_42140 [Thalassoglobus neptunius]